VQLHNKYHEEQYQ